MDFAKVSGLEQPRNTRNDRVRRHRCSRQTRSIRKITTGQTQGGGNFDKQGGSSNGTGERGVKGPRPRWAAPSRRSRTPGKLLKQALSAPLHIMLVCIIHCQRAGKCRQASCLKTLINEIISVPIKPKQATPDFGVRLGRRTHTHWLHITPRWHYSRMAGRPAYPWST